MHIFSSWCFDSTSNFLKMVLKAITLFKLLINSIVSLIYSCYHHNYKSLRHSYLLSNNWKATTLLVELWEVTTAVHTLPKDKHGLFLLPCSWSLAGSKEFRGVHPATLVVPQ